MARESNPEKPSVKAHHTRFGWRLFAHHLANAALLLCIVGIAIGATFGIGPLEAQASKILQADPPQVVISWPRLLTAAPGSKDAAPTTWLPLQFQEELLALAEKQLGARPEPIGRESLRRIALALGGSGWFEGLPSVKREAGGVIRVDGRWRVPAAVVRAGGKDRLISWEAKPMPVSYEPGRSGLKVIVGAVEPVAAGSAGHPDYQRAWPGEQTQAALELLALISREPWADQISGVDVSAYSSKKELVLLTKYGTSIVWGGRPSQPRPGDTSTASKLAKIAMLQRDLRRVDGGMAAVDVWLMPDKPLEIDLTATANAAKP